MNDTEIIASMARELTETKEKCRLYSEAIEETQMYFIGIGGPMNDDKRGFNPEQLKYLREIYHCLEVL